MIRSTFERPDQKTVLLLPGPEFLEVPHLLKVGIRPCNIYALEGNPGVYPRVVAKGKQYGVNVLPMMDFHQFVTTTSLNQFDILLLDFQGLIGTYLFDIERLMRKNVSDDCILMTNFAQSRETGLTHAFMRASRTYFSGCPEPMTSLDHKHDMILKQFQYLVSRPRDDGMYQKFFDLLGMQEFDADARTELINFHGAWKGILENDSDIILPNVLGEIDDSILEWVNSRIYDYVESFGEDIDPELVDKFVDLTSNAILDMFILRFWASRQILDWRAFYYVGDGGTPMFVDSLRLKCIPTNVLFTLDPYINSSGKTLGEIFAPMFAQPWKEFSLMGRSFMRVSNSLPDIPWPGREHLGHETKVQEKLNGKKHRKKGKRTKRKHPGETKMLGAGPLREDEPSKKKPRRKKSKRWSKTTLEEKQAMVRGLLTEFPEMNHERIAWLTGAPCRTVGAIAAWITREALKKVRGGTTSPPPASEVA